MRWALIEFCGQSVNVYGSPLLTLVMRRLLTLAMRPLIPHALSSYVEARDVSSDGHDGTGHSVQHWHQVWGGHR